jgi:hypothetical protein
LIKNPVSSVSNILRNVTNKEFSLDFISDDRILLGETHGIWGNPSLRLSQGEIKLKEDIEWTKKLKFSQKITD